MTTSDQAARAARLRGYFELQLDFAERMAALTDLPIGEAVALYTNLRMRMALGDEDHAEDAAQWARYLAGLAARHSPVGRLDWTQAFFAECPPEGLLRGQTRFGCFSFEAPNAEGMVRIHFSNRDSADGVGPLVAAKIPARLADLTAMFGHIRRNHPEARTVTGGSWLYNVEAYRRLFPAQYGASRVEPTAPVRLRGTSSWGQFLDFREQLRPDLCLRFRDNLRSLDATAPWLAFPFQALRTRAPMAAFYEFYRIG